MTEEWTEEQKAIERAEYRELFEGMSTSELRRYRSDPSYPMGIIVLHEVFCERMKEQEERLERIMKNMGYPFPLVDIDERNLDA